MLNSKSSVISDALDGEAHDYQLQRGNKDECIEEVKTLKEQGKLNPIIVNHKKAKGKITEFFDSKKPK